MIDTADAAAICTACRHRREDRCQLQLGRCIADAIQTGQCPLGNFQTDQAAALLATLSKGACCGQ